MQQKDEIKGIILVGITALCWSFVAIALKIVVVEVPPATIVWFRFTLSFVGLCILISKTNPSYFRILKRPPWLLLLAGSTLGLNYLGILLGVHYTTPSTAQVVIQIGPVLFAVSGLILFKEKINKWQGIGFIIAITGLAIFYNRQATLLFEEINRFNKGVMWTIIAAVGWAVYAISQKKLVKKHPTNQLNLIIYGLPAVFYTFFADFSVFSEITLLSWILLIFLGLNTLVAYSALAEGMKHIEANKASIIITLNPILTFLMMALFGSMDVTWIEKENFTLLALIGAAMVISGAVLVVGKKTKKDKK